MSISGNRPMAGRWTTAARGLWGQHSRLTTLATGIALGALAVAVARQPVDLAQLGSTLSASLPKDNTRLAASAEASEPIGARAGCTALMLDRFTGLTAAIACAQAIPANIRPLRPHEIES